VGISSDASKEGVPGWLVIRLAEPDTESIRLSPIGVVHDGGGLGRIVGERV
jgi:hypothetical protein